jgi:lipopolysaccharide/colanic/teichoic acid biosynthesis glycosyltransferase
MIKRSFDLTFACLSILFFAPLLVVIAFLVMQSMGSPILFRQTRAGFHGKPFEVIKFRTMRNSIGIGGQLQSDSERLTLFGRFLRASSLDELPELWCILRGDMSFVGPRPLLMEYLPLYSKEQGRRHGVLPGLTGWAQINGRNSLSWDDKFKLDVWYVDNQNFWLDLKIITMTALKVFRREGISAEGEATMSKFEGHSQQ